MGGDALHHDTARVGFSPRAWASIIDQILIVLACAGLAAMLPGFLVNTFSVGAAIADRVTEAIMIILVLIYTSFEIWTAGTPGKIFLKLRITNQQGQPADRWRLALRWSIKHSPQFVALFALVMNQFAWEVTTRILSGLIVIDCMFALRESKLALHDQWSGTAVYTTEAELPVRGFVPVVQQESAAEASAQPPAQGS